MVKYDFGVADHQEPPKKPLVQKNVYAKGREPVLMILGKLISSMSMNMYEKYKIETGGFSVISIHNISEKILPHASD